MLTLAHCARRSARNFPGKLQQLRPGTAFPELKVEFFAFANVNNTIRLREGKLLVRLSDLLEGAPDGFCGRSHISCWRRCTGSLSIARTQPAIGSMWAATRSCARRIWFGRCADAKCCVPRGHFTIWTPSLKN